MDQQKTFYRTKLWYIFKHATGKQPGNYQRLLPDCRSWVRMSATRGRLSPVANWGNSLIACRRICQNCQYFWNKKFQKLKKFKKIKIIRQLNYESLAEISAKIEKVTTYPFNMSTVFRKRYSSLRLQWQSKHHIYYKTIMKYLWRK